jgi:hypothetical protein
MAPSDQDEAAALARAALARELGIGDSDRIEQVRVEPVDWPNPSLGCPEKGRVYPQVITPGWRLTFRVEGREWRVHAGSGRAIVCP